MQQWLRASWTRYFTSSRACCSVNVLNVQWNETVNALKTPMGIHMPGTSSARYPTEPRNPWSKSWLVGVFQFFTVSTLSESMQILSLSMTWPRILNSGARNWSFFLLRYNFSHLSMSIINLTCLTCSSSVSEYTKMSSKYISINLPIYAENIWFIKAW